MEHHPVKRLLAAYVSRVGSGGPLPAMDSDALHRHGYGPGGTVGCSQPEMLARRICPCEDLVGTEGRVSRRRLAGIHGDRVGLLLAT